MPLPLANLDTRHFQDLVDEAKRRIPQYCPEWTDHNVSDPGITLIELFAHMMESLLFQLNRVPEKNYVAFMNLLGMQLEPPVAATTTLTFWLSTPSKPGDEPVIIPRDTIVEADRWLALRAGVPKESAPAPAEGGAPAVEIRFSTDRDFAVYATIGEPFFLVQPANGKLEDKSIDVVAGQQPLALFTKEPHVDDAFYIGDPGNISAHILELTLRIKSAGGIGVNPKRPPVRWEAWCGDARQWQPAEVEDDSTKALNDNGKIVLYLPDEMQPRELGRKTAYWLRCVYLGPSDERKGYAASPEVYTIRTASLGGSVPATHSTTVKREILGTSTGDPGQIFRLEYAPVLARRPDERIEVQNPADGIWEPWQEVGDFGTSRGGDQHYTLDSVSGEVRFGPLIREPSGRERQFGARPDARGVVCMTSYRTGGGVVGNVGKHTITLLKTAVKRIDRVTNRFDVDNGLDAETLEHAKLRAPRELRSSSRAVVADDFEHFARQASRYVARARCIQPRAMASASDQRASAPQPGTVRVLIVPSINAPARRLFAQELALTPELSKTVQDYLDERRLLTVFVSVEAPRYIPVRVRVQIRPDRAVDSTQLIQSVEQRLNTYINPLVGGPDGQGWPFGRTLNLAQLIGQLQTLPGIRELGDVQLFAGNDQKAQISISLAEDELLMSGQHEVTLIG
jgi:predicted phage baseplate assembly protein